MAVTAKPPGVVFRQNTVEWDGDAGVFRYKLEYDYTADGVTTPRFTTWSKAPGTEETAEETVNSMIANIYEDLELTPPA